MSDTSIRNLIETQENLGFRCERPLDWGSASSATIPLRNNIMPLYEAKNPTFLCRFADFDRTSETAENAKIGL